MFKKLISDYFSFTKKERTGIIVLLVLIIVAIIIPFLYPLFIHQNRVSDTVFKKQMAALVIKQIDTTNKYAKRNYDDDDNRNYREGNDKNKYSKQPKGELFAFDPNTLDEGGWQRLGIRDKTIATIQKFVAKGGKFYKPEDLGKIWGLHEDEVKRLLPFVQIANTRAANYSENKPSETKTYDKPKYTPSIIDINTADTTALIALPGIGSKLSQRILVFRDKLGGFYTIDQIGETFGLRDSVFQLIKSRFTISNAPVHQININTATLDELKAHPYLRYAVANAIIQYRTQHGNYAAVEDIKKIMLVTDEVYGKAAPYLKVQ